MKAILLLILACTTLHAIEPKHLLVVYREQDPSSRQLAELYARGRAIPAENLIPLATPEANTISRADYNTFIRDPLIHLFDQKKWWKRGLSPDGRYLPLENDKRAILLLRGIPSRIERTPTPKGPDGKPLTITPGQQDEASVDSELAFLGLKDAPITGPLNNPYYNHTTDILIAQQPYLLLTCRIDGPTVKDCERMIKDALAIEKTGLWGTCYLDLAQKGKGYEAGDDWLRSIAKRNRKEGIPTIVEPFPDTLPTNYPMSNASLYFGWYAHNQNGPFLNPTFQFKPGAVAVHLHSFSASDIRHPNNYWTGPLITKGATATVGNVWEPYLTLTHNFEIFHDRLLKGFTLVEAAHIAMPVHSWQSVVIGDPLYKPFAVFQKKPELANTDRDYRAYRIACREWDNDPETFTVKLRTAAASMNSGILYEALGLRLLETAKTEEAFAFFDSASRSYPGQPDKLRQVLHRITIHRQRSEKAQALALIAEARTRFAGIPEEQALIGLQNIINPAAPAPAQPKNAR